MHLRLLRLAKNARWALTAGIACGVLAGLCSLAQAYALSVTVDGVFLGRQGTPQVAPWLGLLLVVILARGLLIWIQEVTANQVSVRVKHELRGRLARHILRRGPAFTRGARSGELASTLVEGIEALDAYFSQYVPQLIISAAVPIAILAVVLPLDPLSGVILLVTAPLIPFFMYMIGQSAEVATRRQFDTLGRLSSHLLDSLQGLATLKIFGQSTAQVQNIARAAEQFRRVTMRVLQVSFLSAFALELLATISTAIVAVEVGLRLLQGQLEFQEALFLLVLAPEFYLPLRALGTRFHAGMAGTAAARRIFDVLDTPVADGPPPSTAPPASSSEFAAGMLDSQGRGVPHPCIEFKHVSFTYPGADLPTIADLDFAVGRGEHIAIVGSSGAGKSTLAGLLLSFFPPSSGEILLQGRPRLSWDDRGKSTQVSWVPQFPHLFFGTVRSNVCLGRPDATDEEVLGALARVQLDEWVGSLPQGLDTPVGEGGARLSSGEAQRLALARALLVDSAIVILDEPTSSLDPENESWIEGSLRALRSGRTVLTLAHRLNTVRDADRILVLEQGRIAEQGTHDQLMRQGGIYRHFIEAGGLEAPFGPISPEPVSAATALPRSPGRMLGSLWTSSAEMVEEMPGDPMPHVLGRLLRFLNGSWRWVALSVALGALTIGSSIALMGTSAWLISAAALSPSIASLQIAIVGVRFFGISRAVFRYLERLVSHGVTFRTLRNIRVWLYSRLEPLAPARLLDFRVGDLMARLMGDVDTLENFYIRVVAPPLTALAVLAGTGMFLALTGVAEIGLLLALVFVLGGVVVPLSAERLSRAPGAQLVRRRADLHAQLIDGIQGLSDLVAFGQKDAWLSRIQASSQDNANLQKRMARITGLHAGVFSIIINSGLWLGLLLMIPRVMSGSVEGTRLASVALIVLSSFEALGGMPLAGQMWPGVRAATRRIMEIVDVGPAVGSVPSVPLKLPAAAEKRVHDGGSPRPPEVEFSGVTFAYPGRRDLALRDITFRLESGASLGIVGPSGAGKSTIASLLLRFWLHDSGEIKISGASIGDLDAEELRAQIGYVSQHPYFFDTSVYENLRLARRRVTFEEVQQAARLAGIHDTIMALPQQYDTPLGEHGMRLSGGERQRLGIARLFIKNAPMAILDEPTANLDAVTERDVLTALAQHTSARTVLHITHRLIGMEGLDWILVLNHGVIAEQGAHSDLLGAGGLYRRLWNLQNRRASSTPVRLADAS